MNRRAVRRHRNRAYALCHWAAAARYQELFVSRVIAANRRAAAEWAKESSG